MAKKEKNKNPEKQEKNHQNNALEKGDKSKRSSKSVAKKILKISAWTFGGIFTFLILLLLFRDPIAKFGITSIGSWITGVEITLEDLDTSLVKGSATVKGLRIANPKNFADPYMMELEEFHADIDLSSLGTKEIVIEDIQVNGLAFTAEFDKSSNFNVTTLTGNLKKRFPPEDTDDDDQEEVVEEVKKEEVKPADNADTDDDDDKPALLIQNIDVNIKLKLVHDFSHATLAMPVNYSEKDLRIAPDDDVPLVEKLDALARYFESFCQACFNAGAFVISAGAEAGEALKSGISAGVDGGKKVFDGGINTGKSIFDSATKLFK